MSSEAKVGIFVVIGILMLTYMSMRVGELSFKRARGYDLNVYFDSATGLAEDIQVEIAGVEVGRVRKISLENGKALVVLRINSDVRLRKDAKAVIRTKGILGDKYVELVQGSPSAPLLKEGDRIVKTVPTTDMDSLMMTLDEVAKNINRLTDSLANVVGGEKGEASLSSIIENIKEMVETLNRTVQENNEDVTNIIANLSEFSETLNKIGTTNREDIRGIISNVRKASEKMEVLIAGINDITSKINRGKGSIGKLVNEEETVNNLNEALASLKTITDKINRGEGSIGKLINEDETVENINTSLVSINDYLQKQDQYKTYLDYRGEYLFDSDELKSYLSLRIQPKEDKYYLLQIVDDPGGKEKVTDTTKDGTTTRTVETDKDALKFSAQIAKRYYDIGLRGGLFESTGGVGLDYYLFSDRLTLSLEAFDFDPDRNAHLKFKADYRPFKHIYITSGFDNFISDEGKESFFIGAGISFADEDIKSLLSDIPIPK
ncbi:MAG: MCE family protein [Desulfobacterales bacterium]|uniref:MCE family protein n=1 Tax=Candidatus Desulfaltia bathyphila TaxID=2841697 RepID=A0A8J6N6T9_9BACT|nr:MCE family protein [Candidatus Desulfaltia bathyphila]MBL7207137.1 MCE family protein [Desulfobacterales bacterium]